MDKGSKNRKSNEMEENDQKELNRGSRGSKASLISNKERPRDGREPTNNLNSQENLDRASDDLNTLRLRNLYIEKTEGNLTHRKLSKTNYIAAEEENRTTRRNREITREEDPGLRVGDLSKQLKEELLEVELRPEKLPGFVFGLCFKKSQNKLKKILEGSGSLSGELPHKYHYLRMERLNPDYLEQKIEDNGQFRLFDFVAFSSWDLIGYAFLMILRIVCVVVVLVLVRYGLEFVIQDSFQLKSTDWVYLVLSLPVCVLYQYFVVFGERRRADARLRTEVFVRGQIFEKIKKLNFLGLNYLRKMNGIPVLEEHLEDLVDGLPSFYTVFTNIVKILALTYLTWVEIGLFCLFPLLSSLFTFIYLSFLANRVKFIEKKFTKISSQTTKYITKTLIDSIKTIKFKNLEKLILQKISKMQKTEKSSYTLIHEFENFQAIIHFILSSTWEFICIGAYYQLYSAPEVAQILFLLLVFRIQKTAVWGVYTDSRRLKKASNAVEKLNFLINIEEEYVRERPKFSLKSGEFSVKNGNFSYEDRFLRNKMAKILTNDPPRSSDVYTLQKLALIGINLKIAKGELVGVFGPQKSGKSTLLLAVQKMINSIQGSVEVIGRVTVIPETPLILPETIRDNIRMGRKFEENFYQKILKICNLKQYIEKLKNGDNTRLEVDAEYAYQPNFLQKIALARAIYTKSDIFLVDNCFFDGFEANEKKELFEAVFLEALKGKTRVLVAGCGGVTRGADFGYFGVLDRVVLLEEGQVVLNEELKDAGRRRVEEVGSQVFGFWEKIPRKMNFFCFDKFKQNLLITEPLSSDEGQNRAGYGGTEARNPQIEAENSDFLRFSNFEKSEFFGDYLFSRGRISTLVLLFILQSLLAVGIHWWIAQTVEKKYFKISNFLYDYIWIGLFLIVVILIILSGSFYRQIWSKIRGKNCVKFVEILMKLPLPYYEMVQGRYLRHILELQRRFYGHKASWVIFSYLAILAQITILMALMLIGAPFVVVVIIPVLIWMRNTKKAFETKIWILKQKEFLAKNELRTAVDVFVEHSEVIRNHGYEGIQWDKVRKAEKGYSGVVYAKSILVDLYSLNHGLALGMVFIGFVLALVFNQLFWKIDFFIDGTTKALILIYSIDLWFKGTSLSHSGSEMANKILSSAPLTQFLKTKSILLKDPKTNTATPQAFNHDSVECLTHEDWPIRGRIDISQFKVFLDSPVSGNRSSLLQPGSAGLALLNLSKMGIKPLEKTAILAQSALERSALILAFFGFLDDQRCAGTLGNIVIDGIKLTEIPSELLRSNICIYSKYIPMYPANSLKACLDPLDLYSDIKIVSALRSIGFFDLTNNDLKNLKFGSSELISSQIIAEIHGIQKENQQSTSNHQTPRHNPEILQNLKISDFGELQKRMLQVAQILLKRSKIIVFEDSGDLVDYYCRLVLQKVYTDNMNRAGSFLVITGKIESMMSSDRVFVLHKGRVVQEGFPVDLVQDYKGYVGRLVKGKGKDYKKRLVDLSISGLNQL